MIWPKTKQERGFTLIELMVVVAIIGVLAAIAIPAFLRYVKSSKTSESEAVMKKFAEGAKAYFASEQRWSEPTGAEPWHVGTGVGSDGPGLPIPFSAYTFPGGDTVINTAAPGCSGGNPDAVGAPTRGQKLLPCLGTPIAAGSLEHATMNKLRVNLVDALYFKYHYQPSGTGIDSSATITAIADFQEGGVAHTVQQDVTADATQDVFISPAVLMNEFQ